MWKRACACPATCPPACCSKGIFLGWLVLPGPHLLLSVAPLLQDCVEAFLHALLTDECKSLRSLDVSNKSEGNCAKQVGLAHRTARRQEGLPAFFLFPRYLACCHSVPPCPSSLSSIADSTVQLSCLAPRLSWTLRIEPGAVFLSSDGLASR